MLRVFHHGASLGAPFGFPQRKDHNLMSAPRYRPRPPSQAELTAALATLWRIPEEQVTAVLSAHPDQGQDIYAQVEEFLFALGELAHGRRAVVEVPRVLAARGDSWDLGADAPRYRVAPFA
jgi:hypothetical protein